MPTYYCSVELKYKIWIRKLTDYGLFHRPATKILKRIENLYVCEPFFGDHTNITVTCTRYGQAIFFVSWIKATLRPTFVACFSANTPQGSQSSSTTTECHWRKQSHPSLLCVVWSGLPPLLLLHSYLSFVASSFCQSKLFKLLRHFLWLVTFLWLLSHLLKLRCRKCTASSDIRAAETTSNEITY